MSQNPFLLLQPHRDQKQTQFPQPKKFPVVAKLIHSPSGRHKAGTSIPASSLRTEAQWALLDFLSSLLAGCYLEDSWKTLDYLQDSSKLHQGGINLVWESNGTAKFKYSNFFFSDLPISYQVFYFLLTQPLFLSQFPRSSQPFEYENLTMALIKEVLITVSFQVILIQRKNINREKRLDVPLNPHIWALISNKPGRLREYFS